MRTDFHPLDPDHLQIHAALAAEYNRTTGNPWGTGGTADATHLYATAFGLGAPTTLDTTALVAFCAAIPLAFQQNGLSKGGTGNKAQLPMGTWTAPETGLVIEAPSSAGDDVILMGEVAGGTTLTAVDRSPGSGNKFNGVKRGCLGTIGNMTSATRGGADAAGYTSTGNVFTLQFAAPWWTGSAPSRTAPLCHQFDPIYLLVMSAGVARWASFSCTMNNVGGDYTKVQYMAYASGMAVDGCIPPAQNVYFPAALINPLGFKGSAGHHFILRDIALSSGSNTGTPADGIGIRRSSNTTMEGSVLLDGFFDGETINGTPWPIAATAGVGQNTDHSKSKAKYLNNMFNQSYVDNSAQAWVQSLPVIGTGLDAGIAGTIGGGRDNNIDESNMGSPVLAHIRVADAGSIETGNWDKVNYKSGHDVVYFEGVRGVAPREPNGIDGLEGWFKVESPSNWVFNDESKMRTLWSFLSPKMRFEAALSINGAGNPTNFSDQPYFLQDCTMTSAVMTAKIVTVFGGSTGKTGCGFSKGDAIQIGNAGPNYTLAASMLGLGSNQSAYTVVEDISDAPTSGSFLVQASFGQQTISYTGVDLPSKTFTGCTGGGSRNILQHATGTNAQTGQPNPDVLINVFNGEYLISDIAADGYTITVPMPQYTGPDAGGTGTTATMGPIGFMRAGTFGRFDFFADWDLSGSDRYVRAGMLFDVNSLIRGRLRVNRNYAATGPRKKTPIFRVRDAETVGSANGALLASYTDVGGTVYTNVLEDISVAFNGSDVGRTVVATNVAGGSDTVKTFIDVNHVQMTGAVTASTGQTWSMRVTGVIDPFGVLVELGDDEYVIEAHAGSPASPDANAIAQGSLVEAKGTPEHNFGVVCSTCSPVRRYIGMASSGSNADATVSVSTDGTGTSALINLDSPSLLVLIPSEKTKVQNSDLAKFIGSAGITADSLLVDDGATNPGEVKQVALTTGVPSTGQRIVGQTPKTTTGAGDVFGRLYPERWT